MKISKKTADASVRVLDTLKILSNNSASIQDIIKHFEKIDPNNRIYTNEVILKYINTLKVFGFRFAKNKDKYILLNSPESFDFGQKDLTSIYLIEKFSSIFPEERIKSNIDQFLQELEKRFSDNTRLLAHSLKRPELNFEPGYNKYSQRIKEYEKYCLDRQRLKITYKDSNNSTISIIVEPNDIKYTEKDIYFNVYNPISAQVHDISFESIIKIEQLPQKSNFKTMLSSVTFELKDRLAKAYKLHEGEKLLQIKTDGNIVVLNQNEDRALLLRRLLRYGENCEVISPKSLREEMKVLIKTIINNYC